MKIGIVGSGIAGLVTAYRLTQAGHDVSLFEKQQSLGMDAHSLSIDLEANCVRADVPSRMFNELQWPSLLSLYREIGVEFQPVNSTQSFGWLDGPTFVNLDIANRPWQAAKALINPRLRKIASEAKRLQAQGTNDLQRDIEPSLTFSQYLSVHQFEKSFVEDFLYPTLSSTVLTCSYAALDDYPAGLVLGALRNLTKSTTLLRTSLGTVDVVQRLTSSLQDIRLSTTVTGAVDKGTRVDVSFDTQTENFDHLVIATQANHANRIVPANKLVSTLESFEYEDVKVVVHTDSTLMPKKQRDWATFNMILAEGKRAAMCSVWLNRFHNEWEIDAPIFQTINPIAKPASARIISQAILQRPVVNANSFEAWRQINQYNDEAQRIWYVGSYASQGIPLLETGVRSSQSVVDQILNSEAIVPSKSK